MHASCFSGNKRCIRWVPVAHYIPGYTARKQQLDSFFKLDSTNRRWQKQRCWLQLASFPFKDTVASLHSSLKVTKPRLWWASDSSCVMQAFIKPHQLTSLRLELIGHVSLFTLHSQALWQMESFRWENHHGRWFMWEKYRKQKGPSISVFSSSDWQGD